MYFTQDLIQIKTKIHYVEMEQLNVGMKYKLYVTFPKSY